MSQSSTTDDAANSDVVIDHDRLAGFIAEIFRHTACSDAEAERIGRSLVGANLAGHDSHGVIRSALYVDLLANGVQLADQE
uniref:Ldh family oxidoreductase n=1 Tax=Candidatus Poriferisodalis multihospitum TaxID=2983191 RepID=UPI002B262F2C